MGEEYLDLTQDILRKHKPPLKRRHDDDSAARGETTSSTPSAATSSIPKDHIVKFMRRRTEADAVRVAAGVLFTVAGIIREHATSEDDSRLLRGIAGELHSIADTFSGEPYTPGAKTSFGPSRRLTWGKRRSRRHTKRRKGLVDAPEEEAGSPSQSSSSAHSHRRRRLLAEHHRHFLLGDRSREPDEEDDGHCLMTTPIRAHTGRRAEEGEEVAQQMGEKVTHCTRKTGEVRSPEPCCPT